MVAVFLQKFYFYKISLFKVKCIGFTSGIKNLTFTLGQGGRGYLDDFKKFKKCKGGVNWISEKKFQKKFKKFF